MRLVHWILGLALLSTVNSYGDNGLTLDSPAVSFRYNHNAFLSGKSGETSSFIVEVDGIIVKTFHVPHSPYQQHLRILAQFNFLKLTRPKIMFKPGKPVVTLSHVEKLTGQLNMGTLEDFPEVQLEPSRIQVDYQLEDNMTRESVYLKYNGQLIGFYSEINKKGEKVLEKLAIRYRRQLTDLERAGKRTAIKFKYLRSLIFDFVVDGVNRQQNPKPATLNSKELQIQFSGGVEVNDGFSLEIISSKGVIAVVKGDDREVGRSIQRYLVKQKSHQWLKMTIPEIVYVTAAENVEVEGGRINFTEFKKLVHGEKPGLMYRCLQSVRSLLSGLNFKTEKAVS